MGTTFNYVLGERQCGPETFDTESHAWLEKDGLIVDITADQFPEVSAKVIVNSHSPWHASFESEKRHAATYRIFDERTAKMLAEADALIRSKLSLS